MAVNVFGVVGIVLFYVIILVIGLWAARRRGQQDVEATSEEVMLAGRSIGTFVGTFTMTATWVGGGYINGTAEIVNKSGLIWAQSGWGYALSLILGGVLFAKVMRQQGFVTMLDPFQQRYGTRVGGIMYVPAFLGELLWSAATLNSLGATISVVFDLDKKISVIVSACVAILYTVLGGLWSVAFTDVAQLICMFIGMWLTIPFALSHDAVASISDTVTGWTGNLSAAIFSGSMHQTGSKIYSLPTSNSTMDYQWRWGTNGWKGKWEWAEFGVWLDYAFLLIFGGIPWQVYFQRVLSSKTYSQAQFLSHAAACGCIFMVIPPTLIGAIGYSTDWSLTGYASTFSEKNSTLDYQQTMPLVLQYLTPPGVSFIGLGAVSAAVMSSVDSSVLSASSMFANNIYKAIIRQNASENELLWVIRISILVVGFLATLIGLTTETIYGLSILCSDLIFVILFPQLLCVIYYRYSNAYGAVISFCFGMLIRLLSGEWLIGLPAVLKFPGFKVNAAGKEIQQFPFRLFTMFITLIVLWLSSYAVHTLFRNKVIPRHFDVANAFGGGDIPPFSFSDMLKTDGVVTNEGKENVLMNTRPSSQDNENDFYGNDKQEHAQKDTLINSVDS